MKRTHIALIAGNAVTGVLLLLSIRSNRRWRELAYNLEMTKPWPS